MTLVYNPTSKCSCLSLPSLLHSLEPYKSPKPLNFISENKQHFSVREGERQYSSYIIEKSGTAVIPVFSSN